MGISISLHSEILDFDVEQDDKVHNINVPGVKKNAVVNASIQTEQTDFSVTAHCKQDGVVCLVFSFEETQEKDTIELSGVRLDLSYIQKI